MISRTHPISRFNAVWQRGPLFVAALAALLVLAMNAPIHAQSDSEATPSRRVHARDVFQATLDSLRNHHGVPGATAAYVSTDGSSDIAASGWADVEAKRPMTPNSRMLAASIGKSFVAATAVALAEEGTLELDVPIGRWLGDRPWFEAIPNREEITVRHLLTHRSGLPDHVHLEAFVEAVSRRWREPDNAFPPDTLVQFVAGRPALFAPGEGWSYSDTGYILVGLILEEVTGRDYYELVQERFLTPLGLTNTRPSDRRTLPGLVAGYSADSPFGWPKKSTTEDGTLAWHPGLEWTGGGLVSTSGDLARWGAALFGGPALSEPALNQMLNAEPVDPAQPDVQYGLGVAVYRTGPFGPVYGHGGWIPGYVSSLRYYPDHGVAIAFQINTDDGGGNDMGAVVQGMERDLAAVVLSAERQADKRAKTRVQDPEGG